MNIGAYIGGLVSGFIISYLFLRIFLRNRTKNWNIHLRHLLHIGILIERQGKDFYDRLAEKANNVNVKNL